MRQSILRMVSSLSFVTRLSDQIGDLRAQAATHFDASRDRNPTTGFNADPRLSGSGDTFVDSASSGWPDPSIRVFELSNPSCITPRFSQS